MTKQETLDTVLDKKVVAVIRLNDASKVINVVEAIMKGGVTIIELTLTTPEPYNCIENLCKEFGNDALVGAGSVLNAEMAAKSIESGANYIVSPMINEEVIKYTLGKNLPVMPGAFSPTEIQHAVGLGADIVKVFPADVLGMKYFKAIKAPLPHLKIMPTGGVSLTNAGDWIKSGACAVGVGSSLLDKKAIQEENYGVLTENAKTIVDNIQF
ncbi:MAG: bifunctional 4-hydroxy-2-oxoglutarate aldolase/2-dehydro-3-deoxy-phosphogluconate aldolase [Ignavibacteria bacterium]|jgi:2-dehydro-3-deoxyphosphogluconate aldolase/(4S)-4-hydroxy-2-oxoglutarate aldolase